MDFDPHNLIVSDSLGGIFTDEMNYYITHAYCTRGRCELDYSGETFVLEKGSVTILMANRLVTELRPSEDFKVKVIYISLSFMASCTPHTSYGVRGGLSMYVNPIMVLTPEEQVLCERDFDAIRERIERPLSHFQGDVMMAVTQTLFIDFYEFHARIYGEEKVSAVSAGIVRSFVDMLLRGDYVQNREVSYYADKLCVTPKYLSEVCKSTTGFSANFWINRFTAIELSRLLRDKSLTLTDIADRFGFGSSSQFSRYVQTYLGASPSAFRS